jgi:hypothetical protein
MHAYLNHLIVIVSIAILTGLYGCATTMSASLAEAQKKQEAMLSRASYEQIRHAIEKIKIGDKRSKVLEVAKPKNDTGRYFKISDRGKLKLIYFHNWPGVLTPFDSSGYLSPEKLEVMHFGYLEGSQILPRRILIIDGDRVSKVIVVPDYTDLLKEPGIVVNEAEPLTPYSKDLYEQLFLIKKDQIVPGMHMWEVFTLLDANYIITPDAQEFVVMCPGFLNYKRVVNEEKTVDGFRSVIHFGYMEGDLEVVKWSVEMLNKRVVAVRPSDR